NLENEISFLRKKFSEFPMTVSGLEVALFRAYLTSQNQNEHSFWGANLTHIETDITIPFLTVLEPLKRWLDDCIKKGFRIFKIKVIGDIELDTHLLLNVYGILQDSLEEFKIRLDGNQGFTEKSFFKLQDIIEKKGIHIECFEQPLLKNNYTGMKNVKKYSHFPVILDETVFNADDMYRAISEDICHGVNIKVAKSGIYESKKIIDLAKKHHLKLMIGCMTETMVGLSAGIYMACGTGVFDFIDLDSIYYLKYKKHYGNIHLLTPFYFISDL
ncbi:MAG: hypothetical protein N2596_00845, partial [Syntrophorhabdaceae bacterium]|nr:hypothetical protein [Syntrophorhabdaceae bacterium]